jgi:hypothetical protein
VSFIFLFCENPKISRKGYVISPNVSQNRVE